MNKYSNLAEFLKTSKVDKLPAAFGEFIDLLQDNIGAEVNSGALITLLLFILSAIAREYQYPPDLIPRLYQLTDYVFGDP